MKQGFVWYDSSARPLEAKVKEAAERYRLKFGKEPSTGYVNPAHLQELSSSLAIKLTASPSILPNHVWLELVEE